MSNLSDLHTVTDASLCNRRAPDFVSGTLLNQALGAYYWAQTEYNSANSHLLHLNPDGAIHPQRNNVPKSYGFTLRCIR